MPGVTKEQIQKARDADLFDYLQCYEADMLKRDGQNYRHKEHDSLVYVTAKNYWYWNSRSRKINALDYLMLIRGYDFVEAVKILAGEDIPRTAPTFSAQSSYKESEPKKFYLPWRKECATSYIAYLQRRGISSNVIRRCSQLGILYESTYKEKEPDGKKKYIPVCVFVGKDDNEQVKFACMRGINVNLRKDAYGSNKEYNFCYPPKKSGSTHLAVFEAPIDALSHATLQEIEGWKWDGYRLSLGGTSNVALVSFLERHPEIKHINLYMDNDLGGLINARKIKTFLKSDKRFKHIRVGINPPHTGKDYNDMLIQRIRARDQPQLSRQKQASVSI